LAGERKDVLFEVRGWDEYRVISPAASSWFVARHQPRQT
jgi:hypothetical protein